MSGSEIIDKRKLLYSKRKAYANEYDPSINLDPWYTITAQGSLYDFIDQYKYSLQKILSIEQILQLRKSIEEDDKSNLKKNEKKVPKKPKANAPAPRERS